MFIRESETINKPGNITHFSRKLKHWHAISERTELTELLGVVNNSQLGQDVSIFGKNMISKRSIATPTIDLRLGSHDIDLSLLGNI